MIIRVVHSILVATAVAGNILVCLVILKTKTFRTPVYYLVLNLAIADLMIVISFTPRHILEGLYHHPRGLEGTILCKTITSDTFTWVGAVASSITLVVIAYERFAAVTSPFLNRSNFTNKKVKIVVVFCWIVAVMFNIPLFWVRNLNPERGFCESHWPSDSFPLVYNAVWLALIGVLPSCLMAFFYGKIIVKMRETVVPRRHASIHVMKARQNITKMLMTITVVYGVCWIPNLILYVVWYVWDVDVTYTINQVFLVLILVNCCTNPVVYSVQNRQFRTRTANILLKCCRETEIHEFRLTISRGLKGNRRTPEIQLTKMMRRKSVMELSIQIQG